MRNYMMPVGKWWQDVRKTVASHHWRSPNTVGSAATSDEENICVHRRPCHFQVNLWIFNDGHVFFFPPSCTSWFWHKWVIAWLWYSTSVYTRAPSNLPLGCFACLTLWSFWPSLSNFSPSRLTTIFVHLSTCVLLMLTKEKDEVPVCLSWQLCSEYLTCIQYIYGS